VFWPASHVLLDLVGWRGAFAAYAALNVVVCLPLHLLYVPRGGARTTTGERDHAPSMTRDERRAYRLFATALALAAILAGGLSAHLIELLTSKGIGAGAAVAVGALIGPMQVAGRIVEYAFARRFRALTVGTFAFALLATSLALFVVVDQSVAVAFVFAGLYGWSNGVMTIVRGVVPAELFGRRGYGALLGRLAMPQLVARALAPLALAAFIAIDADRARTPWLLLACAVAALVAYGFAIRQRRAPDDADERE
jgi:predicted MFS family arabinose efflux permease